MIVEYTLPNGEKGSYGLADWTCRQLDKIKKLINEKDRDYVLIIDGPERSGKSTLATQLGYYVQGPTFSQENLCLTPNDFLERIASAKKGECIIFDEAFTGLASARTMSRVNKLLVEMMMEMGKKNLFVIVCMPSVFYLDKYVALHRARGLFHCYFSKGKPGCYMVYNQKKLKLLYLFGKKKMSYRYPTIYIRKRFPNRQPILWEAYEARKGAALHLKPGNETMSRLDKRRMIQRNVLFKVLNKEFKMPMHIIKEKLGEYDVAIDTSDICEGIKALSDQKSTPNTPKTD